MNRPISREMRLLLHHLEYLIGSKCYHDQIQNYGPGGILESEGRQYRYPLRYRNVEGKTVKSKGVLPEPYGVGLNAVLDEQSLLTAHYAFGKNQLFIMEGLIDVLSQLERKFGLSFQSMLDAQLEAAKPKAK